MRLDAGRNSDDNVMRLQSKALANVLAQLVMKVFASGPQEQMLLEELRQWQHLSRATS